MVEVSELHACGMMRMIINRRFFYFVSNDYGQCSIENIILARSKNINIRTVFVKGERTNNK